MMKETPLPATPETAKSMKNKPLPSAPKYNPNQKATAQDIIDYLTSSPTSDSLYNIYHGYEKVSDQLRKYEKQNYISYMKDTSHIAGQPQTTYLFISDKGNVRKNHKNTLGGAVTGTIGVVIAMRTEWKELNQDVILPPVDLAYLQP